jgi:ubiquinone/menaquinone biosynthesis C-methylase UbiE
MPSSSSLIDGLDLEITRVAEDLAVVEESLDLDGKHILELGCGRAKNTRAIAEAGCGRSLLALEVDQAQHEINLRVRDLPNVTFAIGGAEQIPVEDASHDVVFLFKSLHHVPVANMPDAMREIARVLRPGGYAYIAEPLFRGSFNDCLRLFHDEEYVRREAFGAITASVASGLMESAAQEFFLSPLQFADFAEFEQLVIGATHSSHVLDDELLARVREKFAAHEGGDGARFEQPIRVDLLRRPAKE